MKPKRAKKTPTEETWAAMKNRCKNPSHVKYHLYGGRGITVCERWAGRDGLTYFIEDMGERPQGRTLDRIDPDKGYSKDNCRWATATQQARGRRNTRWLTAFGKTQPMATWCEQYGISITIVRQRILKYRWSVEEALTMDTARAPKGSGKSFIRVPRAGLSPKSIAT